MPLLFAAVLASMAWENAQPFVLDRERGALLDRGRSALSLNHVRAVVVHSDPDELNEYFAINLVLEGGPAFCLRRQWWPMDEDEAAALARAAPIARYLGMPLLGLSEAVLQQDRR